MQFQLTGNWEGYDRLALGVGDLVCPRCRKLFCLEANGAIRNRTKGWSRWPRSSWLWCSPIQVVITTSSEAMVVHREMAFAHTYLLPELPLQDLFWLSMKSQTISWFWPKSPWAKVHCVSSMTRFYLRTVSSSGPFLPLTGWVHLPPSTQARLHWWTGFHFQPLKTLEGGSLI